MKKKFKPGDLIKSAKGYIYFYAASADHGNIGKATAFMRHDDIAMCLRYDIETDIRASYPLVYGENFQRELGIMTILKDGRVHRRIGHGMVDWFEVVT